MTDWLREFRKECVHERRHLERGKYWVVDELPLDRDEVEKFLSRLEKGTEEKR